MGSSQYMVYRFLICGKCSYYQQTQPAQRHTYLSSAISSSHNPTSHHSRRSRRKDLDRSRRREQGHTQRDEKRETGDRAEPPVKCWDEI